MKTAAEYLDAIKLAHGIESDYGLGKLTGWSRSRVSQYRTGLHHFDEAGALKVAELLDIDPAEVLLDALSSRAHSPAARAVFDSIRTRVCVMSTSGGTPARRWTDRVPSFVPLIPPALRNRSSHPSFCIA